MARSWWRPQPRPVLTPFSTNRSRPKPWSSGSSISSLGRARHQIALVAHRLNEVFAARSGRQLPAQPEYEKSDRRAVGTFAVAIDVVDHGFLADGAAAAQGEKLQDLVFLAAERDAASARLDRLGDDIQRHLSESDPGIGITLGPA